VKPPHIFRTVWNTAPSASCGLFAAAAVFCKPPHASAATIAVNLGSASGFAVLAGSGITFAGAVVSINITRDIGSYPTASITGFGNVALIGINHAGDLVTQLAKTDLAAAYLDPATRPPDTIYGQIFDLDGLTLLSGVYKDPSSFAISGNLTLDALGDPSAVWIFQAGSTLTANSGSQIILIGGARSENVFWQVGSSATLDTGSNFSGTIMALESITMNAGSTIDGRLLARNGAVTMGANTTIIPELGSTFLLGSGLAALATRRRRPAMAGE
jgi:hypothetical protein